jgi:hypothetical protein
MGEEMIKHIKSGIEGWLLYKFEDLISWMLTKRKFWNILSWSLVVISAIAMALAIFPTKEGIELGLLTICMTIVQRYVSMLLGMADEQARRQKYYEEPEGVQK